MYRELKKGRISNAVVDFTDFRPTLLDITGCKDDGKYPMDGKSFKPVLENKVDYIDGKLVCLWDVIMQQ